MQGGRTKKLSAIEIDIALREYVMHREEATGRPVVPHGLEADFHGKAEVNFEVDANGKPTSAIVSWPES